MITTSNNNEPDFYLNDTVAISCTASGFTDIIELTLYEMESNESIGCIKNRREITAFTPSLKLNKLGFSYYEQSSCKSIATDKSSGYTISTSAVITAEVNGLRMDCEAFDTHQDSIFRVAASGHAIINHLKGKYYIIT